MFFIFCVLFLKENKNGTISSFSFNLNMRFLYLPHLVRTGFKSGT